MKSNIKIFSFLFVMSLLLSFHSNAQTQDSITEFSDDSTIISNYADSIKNNINEIDTIGKWKKKREFAYIHTLDSLLRKQKNLRTDTVSIDENTGKINRNRVEGNGISGLNKILNSLPVQIFFWSFAFIFILFIFYIVFFKNGIFKGGRKKQIIEKDEAPVDELADISSYDSLVSEAEKENNYNLATRYLFLRTLKNISDKGMIHFAGDKTNREYLNEMRHHTFFSEFSWLTRNYEYLWYGKFTIGSEEYAKLKERFNLFNKKV